MFSRKKRQNRDRAGVVYRQISAQSRHLSFFRDLGVADTINGRFEMLALHLFVLVNRLVKGEETDKEFARLVMEDFVTDMDRNYREIGISDVRVGKKIKAMYGLFGARLARYDLALADGANLDGLDEGGTEDETDLVAAIRAHVFGEDADRGGIVSIDPGKLDDRARHGSQILADYLMAAIDGLATISVEAIRAGEVPFPDPVATVRPDGGDPATVMATGGARDG